MAMIDDVKNEMEELISKYTDWWKSRPNFDKWKDKKIHDEYGKDSVINTIKHYVPDLSNKRILDLGCGMGGMSVAFILNNIRNVISIDLNVDYCKITKLRGLKYGLQMNIVNGVAEFIPLKDNSIDVVIMSEVIEHVDDPELVLNEINRILRLDGKVFITVVNKYTIKDPHYHMFFINWLPKNIAEMYIKLRKKDKKYDFKDRQKLSEMHYFTFSEFEKLANKYGFEVIDIFMDKILNPENIHNINLKNKIKFMKKLRINKLLYKIAKLFMVQSYSLLLIKK